MTSPGDATTRRDFLIDLMLDDLRSGEPVLQKSALLRMRRMTYADFAVFVMRFLKDEKLAADARLREATLLILKEKKAEAARPPDPAALDAFGAKSVEALLADWEAADTRLRLAMLAQCGAHQPGIRDALLDRALADANPILRLEAENLRERAPEPPSPVDAERLIEELRATTCGRRIAKPLADTTVLVVDDAMTVREVLAGHLAKRMRVGKAASAAEALERTAADRYDLIFLDVNLPDRDGLELLAELRERGVDATVVMMTTLDAPQVIQTAFIHGADHYLLKSRLSVMLRDDTLIPELRSLFFAALHD